MIRSVRTLIFLRAVPVLLIKVLMDLENLRDAFFYRHLGPHGPKEGNAFASRTAFQMRCHRKETFAATRALILQILDILDILLQTTQKKRATGIKPMRVSLVRRNIRKGNSSSGLEALHVYSTMAREEP